MSAAGAPSRSDRGALGVGGPGVCAPTIRPLVCEREPQGSASNSNRLLTDRAAQSVGDSKSESRRSKGGPS